MVHIYMQRSEELMRLRVDELKQDMCMLFKASNVDVIGTLTLVDAVQILGVDHLFNEQIDMALRYTHEREFNSSSLYEVALRFRLLREHGLWYLQVSIFRFARRIENYDKNLPYNTKHNKCNINYRTKHAIIPSNSNPTHGIVNWPLSTMSRF
jgi:hypothetical protein